MGSPKALLRDRDGSPFVVRIVRTLGEAGLDLVTVVTSEPSHDAIVRALAVDGLAATTSCVQNPDPDRGQLSSIWVGMDAAVSPQVSGILLTLVDVPFVSSSTVRLVIEAYEGSSASIVRPADGDRHGHPVVFDRVLFEELRGADPSTGAKSVLHAHESEIVNVPVDDEGALADIDTPADYHSAVRKY